MSEAGERLLAHARDVGAIVRESTNMAPYSAARQGHRGVAVHDVVTLLHRFHATLTAASDSAPHGRAAKQAPRRRTRSRLYSSLRLRI